MRGCEAFDAFVVSEGDDRQAAVSSEGSDDQEGPSYVVEAPMNVWAVMGLIAYLLLGALGGYYAWKSKLPPPVIMEEVEGQVSDEPDGSVIPPVQEK